jgi:succinyl-diaminopimelate desuccinylase
MKDLLKKLISIPSVNPSMGGASEAEMSAYLFDRLSILGVEVVRQEVFPGRNNIAARIGGTNEPAVLLEAHMDTVAVDSWAKGDPFLLKKKTAVFMEGDLVIQKLQWRFF